MKLLYMLILLIGLIQKVIGKFKHSENSTRSSWQLKKWMSNLTPFQKSHILKELPITVYAIVVLGYKFDVRTFHWTKFLPADEFTVFFIDDFYDNDKIFDFDRMILKQHNISYERPMSKPNRFMIHMNRKHPRRHAYRYISYLKGEVCAWDKAIFLLGEIAPTYDFVWLFEEDVLVPTVQSFYRFHHTLLAGKYDLATNWITETSNLTTWLWSEVPTFQPEYLPLPYYYSFNCAVGISWNLLTEIREYRRLFFRLDFHEALFPTLAMKGSLSIYYLPDSIDTIRYQHNWTCQDLLDKNWAWLHPVKKQFDFLKSCHEMNIWHPDLTMYQVNPIFEYENQFD